MSSTGHNKNVVRCYFEEVYNGHNDGLIHDLFYPEFTDYSHFESSGHSRVKHMVDFERSVFPDIHFTVEDVMAEEDDVIVRLTIRGTHGGKFLEIAPTGKHVEFVGIQRMRFQEGMISEVVWHHYGLGNSLYASPDGELAVMGPDFLDSSKTYRFDFPGNRCG